MVAVDISFFLLMIYDFSEDNFRYAASFLKNTIIFKNESSFGTRVPVYGEFFKI